MERQIVMSTGKVQQSAGQQQQQQQQQHIQGGSQPIGAVFGANQLREGHQEVLCRMDQTGTVIHQLTHNEVAELQTKVGYPLRPVPAGNLARLTA
jgi:hypothetical protein